MTAIIKTASWFTPLPDDHLRVGISRGVPRFGQIGKGYRMYRKLRLARGSALSARPVSSSAIRPRSSTAWIPSACSRSCRDRRWPRACAGLLRAAEPTTTWCHRSLTARWLSEALGQPVPELGFEGAGLHPLRPPALLV